MGDFFVTAGLKRISLTKQNLLNNKTGFYLDD